jgi:hypothetical protein
VGCDWVHSVRRPPTDLMYHPRMIDDDGRGTVGGMRIGRGNWTTQKNFSPAPLCPPQIAHNLNRARTRAAAVGSRRITAWAMAQPSYEVLNNVVGSSTDRHFEAFTPYFRTHKIHKFTFQWLQCLQCPRPKHRQTLRFAYELSDSCRCCVCLFVCCFYGLFYDPVSRQTV